MLQNNGKPAVIQEVYEPQTSDGCTTQYILKVYNPIHPLLNNDTGAYMWADKCGNGGITNKVATTT